MNMSVGQALLMGIPLALVCALVESVPSRVDDNVTIPLAGGLVLPFLALMLMP
jgi:dolichol kinase